MKRHILDKLRWPASDNSLLSDGRPSQQVDSESQWTFLLFETKKTLTPGQQQHMSHNQSRCALGPGNRPWQKSNLQPITAGIEMTDGSGAQPCQNRNQRIKITADPSCSMRPVGVALWACVACLGKVLASENFAD